MAASSNRLELNSRVSPMAIPGMSPVLSSFVLCPLMTPGGGSAFVSPLQIYLFAHEASQQEYRRWLWRESSVPSLN